MDQVLHCEGCDAHIHRTYLDLHVETYHVPPRREDVIRLSCGDCNYSTSAFQKSFMIRHCLKSGHDIDGVITEWKTYWVMEETRMNEILRAGYDLLASDQKMRKHTNSSEYSVPKFSCHFNPLKRRMPFGEDPSQDEPKSAKAAISTSNSDQTKNKNQTVVEEGTEKILELASPSDPPSESAVKDPKITNNDPSFVTTKSTEIGTESILTPASSVPTSSGIARSDSKKATVISKDKPASKEPPKRPKIVAEDGETELDRTFEVPLQLDSDDKSQISLLGVSVFGEETIKEVRDAEESVAEQDEDDSFVVVDDAPALDGKHIFLPPKSPPKRNQSTVESRNDESVISANNSVLQLGPPPLGEGLEVSAIEASSEVNSSVIGGIHDSDLNSMIYDTIESSIMKQAANRAVCTYCQKTISMSGRKANQLIKAIGHAVSHLPNLRIFQCRYCDFGAGRRRSIKSHLHYVHQKPEFTKEDYEKSHNEDHANEIRECIEKCFPNFDYERRTPILTYIT